MTQKNIIYIIVVIAILFIGYFFAPQFLNKKESLVVDPTPKEMTISGTYVCLPHINPNGPQTMECAFGIKSDTGEYYAVNFGASQGSMDEFQAGSHITAEGFFVPKEALSTDSWNKYNMKGIFTITKKINVSAGNLKININEVCDGALAYMTFPDGKTADQFVKDCKEGKYPEVIEKYKQDMGLGDGANI